MLTMQATPFKPKRGSAIPTRFTQNEIASIDKAREALGRLSRSTFIRFATNIVVTQAESGVIKLPAATAK
ncbi:MAG: hypothetical protein IKO01_07035 [Kiritimatiellae bacterium]|nr:hypothetical protein [Kiritimatiellia bacterium]